MARYEIPCTNMVLIVDGDAQTITINRHTLIDKKMPQQTVIPFDQLTKIETKEVTFALPNLTKGNITMRFEYPGCPQGGNMMFEALSYENMVQYKAKSAGVANEVLALLRPLAEANKARLG